MPSPHISAVTMATSKCNDNEKTSLLTHRRRLSLVNNNLYRYPLVTILSVIDEDPNESCDEGDSEVEISRRQSMHQELQNSWRLGIFLAVLSGIFFTATSIMVQYFAVPAMEIFLVRSIFQSIIMGLVASASPYNRRSLPLTWRLKLWVGLQALLGAVRLYINYLLLAYLPLGDAVTIMFIEPLFTVVLSFIFLRIAAGFLKIFLCLGLLLGMILTVQPPFIFGEGTQGNSTQSGNFTTTLDPKSHRDDYYKGVTMALSCAVMGALCNILINKCEKIRSTVLVFYGGVCGIFVALIGWLMDPNSNMILTNFEALKAFDWVLLISISLIGICAIFTMTAALKMVSPTSVSVLKALEIIFAFLFQIIVMHQIPNAVCLIGAALVTGSILGISFAEGRVSQTSQEHTRLSARRGSMSGIAQIGPTYLLVRPDS